MTYLTFLTPIATALIAVFAGCLGLIISKENKVSEFRQAWIDQLRQDVSAMLSHIAVIDSWSRRKRLNEEFWDAARQDMFDAYRLLSVIRLRLNPVEHKAAITHIVNISAALGKWDEGKEADIEKSHKALLVEIDAILKTEWARVKVGEPWFKHSKWFIAVLALALAVALLAAALLAVTVVWS